MATDRVRGDIYCWGELTAGALIASIPAGIADSLFLDRYRRHHRRCGRAMRLAGTARRS